VFPELLRLLVFAFRFESMRICGGFDLNISIVRVRFAISEMYGEFFLIFSEVFRRR